MEPTGKWQSLATGRLCRRLICVRLVFGRVDGFVVFHESQLCKGTPGGLLLGFLLAHSPGTGEMAPANGHSHLEALAVIRAFLVEHFIERGGVKEAL